MTAYIIRRLLTVIPITLGVLLLVFVIYMSGIQLFPNLKYMDWNVLTYSIWGIVAA